MYFLTTRNTFLSGNWGTSADNGSSIVAHTCSSKCTCTVWGKARYNLIFRSYFPLKSCQSILTKYIVLFSWVNRFWLFCFGPLVPDEGYFTNASCALNLISTFLFWRLSFRVKFTGGKYMHKIYNFWYFLPHPYN